MKPEEAGRRLSQVSSDVTAAIDPLPVSVLVDKAKDVAGQVRALAARNGHQIAVRVVEKHNGVRVTVRGPHASRYRAVAERELQRALPETTAEVRAQITRKIR